MILLDVVCRARSHGTASARRRGCVCPDETGAPTRSRKPQRTYIRSRAENRCGPTLRTVTEPDEIAVERIIGGDRSLTVAAVERWSAVWPHRGRRSVHWPYRSDRCDGSDQPPKGCA